jgi:hypothetical protein
MWIYYHWEFLVLFIGIILLFFTYHLISKNDSNLSIDARINMNLSSWLLLIIISCFIVYQKGQMNAINGRVEMQPKIIKKYSRKTGELVKQDTFWVYKRYIEDEND